MLDLEQDLQQNRDLRRGWGQDSEQERNRDLAPDWDQDLEQEGEHFPERGWEEAYRRGATTPIKPVRRAENQIVRGVTRRIEFPVVALRQVLGQTTCSLSTIFGTCVRNLPEPDDLLVGRVLCADKRCRATPAVH